VPSGPTDTPTPLPPTDTPTPLPPTNTPVPPTNTPTPLPPPPTVGSIVPLQTVAQVGSEFDLATYFTITTPIYVAVWDWGDGSSSSCPTLGVCEFGPDDRTAAAATSSLDDGSFTVVKVTGSHAYSEAGVYAVQFTVTDSVGQFDTSTFEYVVVYDPSAGFVTGGGWIDSPEGAFKPDPSLTGKATFGFVSKYAKGASVPTGDTEFQFRIADLNFHSDWYQWLVVDRNGSRARFKGEGTINGAPAPDGNPYQFMISATDGDPDTLRIKIWYESGSGDEPIYDNDPFGVGQPIGGGSIVVHDGKAAK
jgi:hypothetical protein